MSIFAKDALADKSIIVTGASGEIGKAVVHTLVNMGANVTASGRNMGKLDYLQETETGSIQFVQADIRKPDEREHLVEKALEVNGSLYGLVNAAAASGSFGGDHLESIEEDQLTNIMETNWTATVLLTQLAYKKIALQREGAIINISSLSGIRGVKGNIPYSSSKFALIGFTQSLAVEAIEHGVRVNAICPGYVDTEMGYHAILSQANAADRSYEEQLKLIEEQIPSGHITQPAEVANITAFLLTDATRNIVGESVKMSGGVYM
ncbi:SDR family NAD(P)-dependent oxidoreductase [Oceanobacillus jeddahense]|uniref:SDR family oxidoreductase n=1 Tax=Oceanobacillus jeddahense TaxID=1462527 RepID=A0ABY5JWJ1_9BACI|nr:SDR family oxidoreductase [Oceanobacillus jeddahense]UUI04757.1 SDR family oxidoreductase [Oceanobacillus jeddahense]